jgi:peroxiredoxin
MVESRKICGLIVNKLSKVVLVIACFLVPTLEFAMTGCSPSSVSTPTPGPTDDGKLLTYQSEINLLGEKREFFVDSQGTVKSKVQVSSADGRISLSLDKGATALDKDGKPLRVISAVIDPNPPPPPEDAYIVGAAYNLEPQGAEFHPWLKLTLSYEPEKLPEGVRGGDLYVAYYNGTEWCELRYKKVNTEAHSVTTQVYYFTTFAILGPKKVAPSSPSTPVRGTRTGNLAPDFQLQSLDGQSVSLSGLQGKPVLLNFWATRCPPCRNEMPYLQAIYNEWSDRELILLAINIGEGPSKVEEFMQSQNLSLPVLLDTNQDVALEYNIRYIPTTFSIDKKGIIRAMKVGGFSSKEEIEGVLTKIIP